jgi:2-methylcitrate dehydratase PrpD
MLEIEYLEKARNASGRAVKAATPPWYARPAWIEDEMVGLTSQLAEYSAGLRFSEIPREVVDRAKLTLADSVGVMAYGGSLPWGRMIVDYAGSVGATGGSRILSAGGRTVSAPAAALANGVLAHSFELDGAVKPSVGVHPAATTFPAALAVAQESGAAGRDVIAAFVAASEVMIRIGRTAGKSAEERGFHGPGATGPFGATIAAARLLHLDGAQIASAMGIAGSLAGGLMRFSRSDTGGVVKALHFGRAAESGVVAANLVRRGFAGPDAVLEGAFGFLHAFCGKYDTDELLRDLGEAFGTMSIAVKRYPCHGTAQGPVELIETLKARQHFAGDDVRVIEIAGSPEMVAHDIKNPKDLSLALYSVPFAVAVACYKNPRDPRSFDADCLSHRGIRSLCSRIRISLAGDSASNRDACSVRITLGNGVEIFGRLDAFAGHPKRPLAYGDLYAKYCMLTQGCSRRNADEIFERVERLEDEDDLAWLAL